MSWDMMDLYRASIWRQGLGATLDANKCAMHVKASEYIGFFVS